MLFLRGKHYLATNAQMITAVCFAVVLVGGLIASTGFGTPAIAASPHHETQIDEQTTHAAGVTQEVSVTVTEDTGAFTTGDTLTDRSLYPRMNTDDPLITGKGDAQDATVSNIAIVVTYEAAPRTDTNAPFYTDEEILEESHPDSTEAEVTASLPTDNVFAEKDELREEFGSDIVVTATVETVVTYTYDRPDGVSIEHTVTAGGPLEETGNMYSLPSKSNQQTHSTGEEPATQTAFTSLVNGFSIFGTIIGVAGIVAVAIGTRTIDAKSIAREIQKRRFNDWVTEVESYTPQGTVNAVEVTTLNDLVNLAIDTQRRVLYHRQVNEYIVVDGATLFKYVPEGEGSEGNTELFGMNPDDLDLQPAPKPQQWSDMPTDSDNEDPLEV